MKPKKQRMLFVKAFCAECFQEFFYPVKDFTKDRPLFCSARCFRRIRDHLHGNVHDEPHRQVCDQDHGEHPSATRLRGLWSRRRRQKEE